MMNDTAIDSVVWFTQLPEFQVNGYSTRAELEEQSYSRWIAYELLNEIMDHPSIMALDTLNDLWLRMVYYYQAAKTPRAKKQFEIALGTLDTLSEIIERWNQTI